MTEERTSSGLTSVILPCRNERKNILPLIAQIRDHLEGRMSEVVVVDDGDDGAREELSRLRVPGLRVLRGPGQGLARAVRAGLDAASGDVLVVMDSDFDHHPAILPALIEGTRRYPCVSVSRFLAARRLTLRYALSRIFQSLSRGPMGLTVSDCLYGYFAFRRGVLRGLDADDIFRGAGDYTMRFFHHLEREGIAVCELPALASSRRSGRGSPPGIALLARYLRTVRDIARRVRHSYVP